MSRDFTDWDAGLHRKDGNSLKHYGVPGMKWRERREGMNLANPEQLQSKPVKQPPSNDKPVQGTATTSIETPKKKFDKNEVMKQRREAALAAKGGEFFDANKAMAKRREAALAARGGEFFDPQKAMARRREVAKAAGKGNWNAQEEMRKRREAAKAKKG